MSVPSSTGRGVYLGEKVLASLFKALATLWSDDPRVFMSSTPERYDHPAYRAILLLGKPVVPLLLEDLRKTRGHWDVALHKITGVSPPREVRDLKSLHDWWLNWGINKGHIA